MRRHAQQEHQHRHREDPPARTERPDHDPDPEADAAELIVAARLRAGLTWAEIAERMFAAIAQARARAEGLGMRADVGIAERADRLVAALVTTGFVGMGLPEVVLKVVLGLLAVASVVTIFQRVLLVRRQAFAPESSGTAPAGS